MTRLACWTPYGASVTTASIDAALCTARVFRVSVFTYSTVSAAPAFHSSLVAPTSACSRRPSLTPSRRTGVTSASCLSRLVFSHVRRKAE